MVLPTMSYSDYNLTLNQFQNAFQDLCAQEFPGVRLEMSLLRLGVATGCCDFEAACTIRRDEQRLHPVIRIGHSKDLQELMACLKAIELRLDPDQVGLKNVNITP